MLRAIKKLIPANLKAKLVNLHFLNRVRARQLAVTAKRLDLCAAQFALLLHLSPHTVINGKVCVEIGSGWVLSHALICYLLGAEKVIATDVTPMANPLFLKDAVRKSELSIVRDVLSPYSSHGEIRERLNRLMEIKDFTFSSLKRLGIEYQSPFDFAKQSYDQEVDLIYSFSVLEHIPVEDIKPFLRNVSGSLKPGGGMLHCIHMEDHKDFSNPFDFYSISKDSYPRDVQTIRSNRVRRSQWSKYFSEAENLDVRFIYEWSRNDRELPDEIDPSVLYEDEDDLRVSHLGVFATRKS